MQVSGVAVDEKTAMRNAILSQAMDDFGLTEDEFFGRGHTQDMVAARRKASHNLRKMGLSYTRIAAILKRDHSTIMNYFGDLRARRGAIYGQRRIFRHLSADLCEVIMTIAKDESITIETLMAQWVGERAAYELAAKARAA